MSALTVAVGLFVLASPPVPMPERSLARLAATEEFAEALASPVLEDINAARRERHLAPLRLHPDLCVVSDQWAQDVARGGRFDTEPRSVGAISRALLAAGYPHHHWQQTSIHFAGPADELVETWRDHRPDEYESLVYGDFVHLGLGVSELSGVPVYVLLAALPREIVFARRTAALHDVEEVRRRVVAAVNRRRDASDLSPLNPDDRLHRAAQRHAESMLREDSYSHVGAEGSTLRERLAEAGYDARRAAENLARGLFSPEEVVERWMRSPGHRRNILDPRFEHIGVGVAFGATGDGEGEVDWVQVFASPDRVMREPRTRPGSTPR